MSKILLTDSENYRKKVDLIRYFKFKSDYFLIYTMGETDEKDFVKLYLVKIMEELGTEISVNIEDEAEWKSMQDVVKKVIKEIKTNNKKLLQDLDPKEIAGIKIETPRFFKLDEKLVSILSSNYEFDENSSENYPNNEPIENNAYENLADISQFNQEITPIKPNVDDIDYKALYIAVKEEKEAIDVLLDDLTGKLIEYTEKYGEINH